MPSAIRSPAPLPSFDLWRLRSALDLRFFCLGASLCIWGISRESLTARSLPCRLQDIDPAP